MIAWIVISEVKASCHLGNGVIYLQQALCPQVFQQSHARTQQG